MKIVIAQLNPVVGDIDGNFNKIISVLLNYENKNVDLFIFPELFLTGYPPRDLLERNIFIQSIDEKIKHLVKFSKKFPKFNYSSF